MTIAMGGAEISFRGELERWINETLTSDFVISSSFSWLDTSYPALPPDVGPLIAATEGVGGVTGLLIVSMYLPIFNLMNMF